MGGLSLLGPAKSCVFCGCLCQRPRARAQKSILLRTEIHSWQAAELQHEVAFGGYVDAFAVRHLHVSKVALGLSLGFRLPLQAGHTWSPWVEISTPSSVIQSKPTMALVTFLWRTLRAGSQAPKCPAALLPNSQPTKARLPLAAVSTPWHAAVTYRDSLLQTGLVWWFSPARSGKAFHCSSSSKLLSYSPRHLRMAGQRLPHVGDRWRDLRFRVLRESRKL